MGHPMEGYYDGLRAERDRLWRQRDALYDHVKAMPLSSFTVEQLPDLQLLVDRSAPGQHALALREAMKRLAVATKFKGEVE